MRRNDSNLRSSDSVDASTETAELAEFVPVPEPRPTLPTWLTATLTLFGGMAFAAIVFLFLAALQPTNPDAQKFERSELFKGQIEPQPPKKAPPPSEQKKPRPKPKPPEKKPPKKPVRKVVQKTLTKPQPRQQVTRSVEAPRSLGNLGVLGSGTGGGVAINVDINSAVTLAQAEVQEFEDYEDAQRRLSESADAGLQQRERDRRGSGGPSQARKARLQSAPKPPYPPKARQAGKDGTVFAQLFVSTDGRVENHEIDFVDPAGFGFEEAFVKTLPLWRFTAAKDEEGRPTGQWVQWQYQFSLNE